MNLLNDIVEVGVTRLIEACDSLPRRGRKTNRR
jgi:hypothetical protein